MVQFRPKGKNSIKNQYITVRDFPQMKRKPLHQSTLPNWYIGGGGGVVGYCKQAYIFPGILHLPLFGLSL